MSQRDDPVIVRTTLVDPVCFLVLKILVQGPTCKTRSIACVLYMFL